MQQWHVNPITDYVYANSSHNPNEIHSRFVSSPSHPYQDLRREHFPFNPAPAQNAVPQQHHQAPIQPIQTIQPIQSIPHPMQQPMQQPIQSVQPVPPQTPLGVGVQQPSNPSMATPQLQKTLTPGPSTSRSRKRSAPGNSTAVAAVSAAASQSVSVGGPIPPNPTSPRQGIPMSTGQPDTSTALPTAPTDRLPDGPPAKKSRTNTPWTPAEEHRLKQMRDAGSSWSEIAKTFPARTEGSVKKHWYKDMHYAEFAANETTDELTQHQELLDAIKDYQSNMWKVIGAKVGKPAKACEQYAKEHFPDMIMRLGHFR